jgi:RNA polymerase sigma-70 factor (ECF subfamily)
MLYNFYLPLAHYLEKIMARHSAENNHLLLCRLKQGDEPAFEALYWQYSAWVYNFFKSILYDPATAEDLTQNLFLKLWEKRDDIEPDEHFEAYLFTIARNMARKEVSNRQRREQLKDSLAASGNEADTSLEQQIEADSLQAYVNGLVEQLPPACRQIYRLSRVEQLSNKEIAQQLSLSEKTVEAQLHRALRFLKQKLM